VSIFEGVLNWFPNCFQKDAAHRLAPFIPDGGGPVVAGEHYVRLWLDEMFLANERDWFKSWHPAVHSAITFEFGEQTQVITRIAGASALKDVDDRHLDRVITLTTKLTDLLPFRGGTVRINAALLAMQGTDSVKQLIDVLGEISTKLAVPQLSMALDVAKPLAQGVSALVGVTDGEMMLGLDTTISEQDLRGGSFAVVFATPQEIPPARLTISARQLRFDGHELNGRNYMVVRVERVDARGDWDQLSKIREPYQQAVDALTEGELPAAQKALKKAIGAALKSDDLTETDRRRVIDALRKRYKAAEELLGSGAFSDAADQTVEKLLELAIPPAEAAALGPIKDAEAFDFSNI